jgi:hypothetical protein
MEWKRKIRHELIEYWSCVAYLAFFFGVFSNYRRLILAHYQIVYHAYWISVIKALILAKVILVAGSLRLDRGFEDKPLIVPTLHKAFLLTVCAALFDVVEELARSLWNGKDLAGAAAGLAGRFDYEWFAGALVVFFALVPFFAVRQLSAVLGKGAVTQLFFRQRSTLPQSQADCETRQGREKER